MSVSTMILDQIKRAAPAGWPVEGVSTQRHLAHLVTDLLAASPDAVAEYARYLRTAQREIEVPGVAVSERLTGRRVVVTGATGCIGTALLHELRPFGPARVAGVGITPPEQHVPGVEYRHVDIRDEIAMKKLLAIERPEVVFHLTSQRDPGLAEDQVHETVSVNILGPHTVARACEATGVAHFVLASTGKAMRLYYPDV
jgi:FlaA1/EpsC-like NDP-sugar epimerase